MTQHTATNTGSFSAQPLSGLSHQSRPLHRIVGELHAIHQGKPLGLASIAWVGWRKGERDGVYICWSQSEDPDKGEWADFKVPITRNQEYSNTRGFFYCEGNPKQVEPGKFAKRGLLVFPEVLKERPFIPSGYVDVKDKRSDPSWFGVVALSFDKDETKIIFRGRLKHPEFANGSIHHIEETEPEGHAEKNDHSHNPYGEWVRVMGRACLEMPSSSHLAEELILDSIGKSLNQTERMYLKFLIDHADRTPPT